MEPPETPPASAGTEAPPVDPAQAAAAFDLVGLAFEPGEVELAARRIAEHRQVFERLRAVDVPDDLSPAFRFEARLNGVARPPSRAQPAATDLPEVTRPPELDALAWLPIPELAALVRSRQVLCVELVTLAIERLRRLDPVLRCVVTLTEERALAQARARDAELDAGVWRGPLHGIPWGAKDLLAVRGYPTTWGTPPFAEQRIEADATVVSRLDEAGAVLVAKLSLGELAWGDVWTGGRTNNPWDLSEGSSGSSAGSAAAVAAGAVPFAIGSETLGSIVSPSRVCGVTGLRPTFGRVSRHGAMALSWTLDKLGPICRSAEDAAIVFAAIVGPDGLDETVVDAPFALPAPADPSGLRIGVVESAFRAAPAVDGALDELRGFGCELVPIELPDLPIEDLWLIGEVESAAAFDDLLRDGGVRAMVRKEDDAWPNVFRAARLVPAVEYLRATRIRRRLQLEFAGAFRDLDLLVHPSDEGITLTLENMTGHPAVALPWGRRANGAPDSVTLAGHLDGEADLLAFARAWQDRTDHHRRRPPV